MYATTCRSTHLCVCGGGGLVCIDAWVKTFGGERSSSDVSPQVLSTSFIEAGLLLAWVSSTRLG